ncbi:hypothetical protein [Pseudomonas aeruginosa]|uniref:hypothetical protein n=1 Tax=Pseudomonas aeruginosa TaxID=287 RepID=UPI00053D5621|nr:hypothetical protein [Pseudomonas aeruginosa]ELL0593440.1 hypothetical protein [Pseudomonas aeruginosa]ELP1279772.1 hypothetical protein [Pseudomonas aeruginosa]KAB0772921.1 hypothetical protein F7P00_23440 [Pseudomonas aeruginosa]KQK59709.1 hypothetical protein AOX62_12150 [Pseudomonas aeruginosa]KQK60576.1 hypothetical protein AOX61_15935 [Pseudomonas aeruginosa]
MKTCTVFGDMQSDSTAEQYPTVTLCNNCVEQDALSKDDRRIISLGAYDESFGDSCEWCGTTTEEEGAVQ